MLNINILKIKHYSYFISIFMIITFIGGIIYKKGYEKRDSCFLYSVEFTGGYQITMDINTEITNTKKIIETEELKHRLESLYHQGISIRAFGKNKFLLRFPANPKAFNMGLSSFAEELKINIINLFPESTCTIEDSVYIGAGISDNLWQQGLIAILVALLLMFIYIWIRFPSWHFSVANLISLLHDVFGILLFLMWSNTEISLDTLISILFIIGYSINDTIVIFSAIREQLRLHKDFSYDIIINKSIQLTLRRTLLTSFFTSLVVIPMWLFGGYILHALAMPILLGIIFGTYSSIAIASTILYDIYKYK